MTVYQKCIVSIFTEDNDFSKAKVFNVEIMIPEPASLTLQEVILPLNYMYIGTPSLF